MRNGLLISTLLLAAGACASAIPAARPESGYALPPVEVYRSDARAGDPPSLVINRKVLDAWNFLYRHISDTEFALCLEGTRAGQGVVITGFRLAHILVSNFNAIKYEPCPGDALYIGTAHNHPPGDYPGDDPCYQSKTDQLTFRGDANARVDIIICGRDRFVWALRDGRGPQSWPPKHHRAREPGDCPTSRPTRTGVRTSHAPAVSACPPAPSR